MNTDQNRSKPSRVRSVSDWVQRAIGEADERLLLARLKTVEQTMAARDREVTDAATGINNQTAFRHLVCRVLVWCAMTGRKASLLFFDVVKSDGTAELTQRAFAGLLATEFRLSDVKGRINTNGFGVLVPDATSAVLERIEARVEQWNARPSRPCDLAYRARSVPFDPRAPQSLNELLMQAETGRAEEKRPRTTTV